MSVGAARAVLMWLCILLAGAALAVADDPPAPPTDAAAETPTLETLAPETAAPETAAPETAAPETGAPETAAPETGAPETAAPETPAAAVRPDPNVLQARLAEIVRTNPKLRGAWLHAEYVPDATDPEATPGHFRFTRVLDRRRADEQREELDRVLQTWLPPARYEVQAEQDKVYPFSDLLESLQDRTETDPRLGGCMVSGAYYAPTATDPDALLLVLQGRVAQVEQRDVLDALCVRQMRLDRDWVLTDRPPQGGVPEAAALAVTPSTNLPVPGSQPQRDELEVVRPSPAKGRWFFDLGVRRYWREDYSGASQAFRLAVLEAPQRMEYLYWWALAELTSGNQDRAYDRLLRVARGFNIDRQAPSREYRQVAQSLARVQGTLRHRLRALEGRALFDASRIR